MSPGVGANVPGDVDGQRGQLTPGRRGAAGFSGCARTTHDDVVMTTRVEITAGHDTGHAAARRE